MIKRNLVTAALLVSLFTILFQLSSSYSISKASEDSNPGKSQTVEFVSNQILVRLSEEASNTVSKNIQKDSEGKLDYKKANAASGVEGVDQFARANGAVEIKPVFSKGADKAKSNAGEKSKEKLKQWYVLTLDKEEKKIASSSDEYRTLEDLAEALKKVKGVEAAGLNGVLEAAYTPNDTYYSSQYAPAKIKADLAWDLTEGTSSAIVAIIDTGIMSSHSDLTGRVIGAVDFTSSPNGTNDINGHGTHVAGIVAANTNNSTGVAGIASKVSLLNVKSLGDGGSGSISQVADGIEWAADNDADIINMSLGANLDCDTVMQDALDYAWSENVLIVAAGGNGASNDIHMPAICNHVISVAATDSADALASFSNYHSSMTLAAPGVDIYSTLNSGSYGNKSGTSMATPMVAGVAALVKSANSYLNNQEMYDILTSTADPITGTGTNWQYGRVDAQKALAPSTRIDETSTYCISGTDPRIHVQWTSVPNAVSYNIYRTAVGGSESYFGNTSGIAANDDTVYSGQQYTYRIVAVFADSSTLSGVSQILTAETCVKPNLNGSTAAYCNGAISRIHVQWNTVADTYLYKVYRTPSGGSESLIGTTSGIAMNDETVTGGQSYSYRVEAWFPDSNKLNGDQSSSYAAVSCP